MLTAEVVHNAHSSTAVVGKPFRITQAQDYTFVTNVVQSSLS